MLFALVSCVGPVQPVPAPASPANRGPWRIVKYDDQKRPVKEWVAAEYMTGLLAEWVEFRGADGKMVRVSGSFSIKEQ